MEAFRYFNRDISWLSFNERVLMEAGNGAVLLMERIRFLSIYSSNLDEFYRVRMPYLQKSMLLDNDVSVYEKAQSIIDGQLDQFGKILGDTIIPELARLGIRFCYKEPVPESVASQTVGYFYSQVAGFLQPVF